ncbi:hypothetical protein RHMOL_Rhmol10G0078900 [Rhododendron molle]|uniref:Uncharacterized protein n=1 Tax=Rhododendron molle TaxID=49168 RepID=A0ACC0M111_RHOML|nr:hypothetical protein RHMOL_Rhmol10G0078900 [Rhododendron molle]
MACMLVCQVIRRQVWGDWVEKRLRDLDVSYSSELVSMILRELGVLRKEEAMMFFRWLQESNLFDHDGGTYNTMLSILGNKGSKIIETFSWVAEETRGAGFGMSEELYSHVLSWFDETIHTSWVIEDAVDLYELAMGGVFKPSIQDCFELLRRAVVVTGLPYLEVDMNLFHRVIKTWECNKILKAMEEMKKNPSKRTDSNNPVTVTAEIFSKSSTRDEFKLELDSNDIGITQDLGERVLQQLGENPDAAQRFFGCVLERESKWLSKVSCLLMLGILRSYGSAKVFWDLFEVMRMKGYSVRSREMYGLRSSDEVGYMNFGELYFCSSLDEMACSLVCQVIEGEWGDGLQKRLRGLDVSYSSKLVSMILGKLREARWARYRILYSEMFFRWLQETNLFEHDEETYNAMLAVLGTQLDRDRGSLETFWRVADEMTGAGFEMSEKCYWDVCSALVLVGRFKDAVDLYEFARGGADKIRNCSHLLKNVSFSTCTELDRVMRVVKAFAEGGNALTDLDLVEVFEPLICHREFTCEGGLWESKKFLRAMEDGRLILLRCMGVIGIMRRKDICNPRSWISGS